jgi:hypothetical protein
MLRRVCIPQAEEKHLSCAMKFMSTVQRTYLVHKQACAAYLPFADEPCSA